MKLTLDQLRAMAGGPASDARDSNMGSALLGLERFGGGAGLDRPSRLAHYLAQLLHESTRFLHDREVWGPTKAQLGYEGRKDLGNIHPGDGSKFRGYTPGQITGRYNTTQFYQWCVENFPGVVVPNFVESPHLMNTDPWEGLGPIWYWDVGNPEGKTLNRYADENNIEMVTRRINGGLNGYADRLICYDRAALVFLGYAMGPKVIERFQRDNGLVADDISGPKTRAAMHLRLVTLDGEWVAGTTPPTEVVLPPVESGLPPVIVTPEWTAREHIANIRASAAALESMLEKAA